MPTSTSSPGAENNEDEDEEQGVDVAAQSSVDVAVADGIEAGPGPDDPAVADHGEVEEVAVDIDKALDVHEGTDAAAAAAAAAVAEAFAELDPPVVPVAVPPPNTTEQLDEPAAGAISAVVAAAAAASASSLASENKLRKYKKRVCKFPGCTSSVKAQGHCQRHGAKIKRCKHTGCTSQAQGSHEGYCKRHWREFAAPEDQRKKTSKKEAEEIQMTCEPIGSSVYDNILPASFAWKVEGSMNGTGGLKPFKKEFKLDGGGMAELENIADVKNDVLKVHGDDQQVELIPILQHLLTNESLDPGWHRANERLARGICPPKSLSTQLETWEKQLAVMEMALIAGTETMSLTPHRVSKVLAHAWGREKGFHKLMVEKHCQRRGDLERKKRVDAGVPISPQKRAVIKMKYETNKSKKRKVATAPSHQLFLHNGAEVYAADIEHAEGVNGQAMPLPVNEQAMAVEVNEPAMAEVVDESPMAQLVGESPMAAEEVTEPPMAEEVNEPPMAEMVNVGDVGDGSVPYSQAPPPPLEEPSIEEMVTEEV